MKESIPDSQKPLLGVVVAIIVALLTYFILKC
jgi:hypothetical protein